MKTIITIMFLCVYNFAAAQEVIDAAYLKCSYEYKWEFDTLSHKDVRNDILYLQIGKHASKCFSYYTYQCDSLRAAPNGDKEWRRLFFAAMKKEGDIPESFPHHRMTTCVYKSHPTGKVTVTDFLMGDYYAYEEEMNSQSWDIEDSVKTIMGHECQKAVSNFRGRQWTAWFASDIPVSDGPWKFTGLPGLIMEVYDHNRQQYFVINGLQKISNEPIQFVIYNKKFKKLIKTDRLNFLKSESNYLHNQSSINEAATGISLGSGTGTIHYDLIERDYK